MRPPRTCKCGHTRSHQLVTKEPEYSTWGWICLSIFGITPKPERITFRCSVCHESLGVTRDPRILRGDKPEAKAESDEAKTG